MAIVNEGSGDIPNVDAGLYTFKIVKTKSDVRQDDTFGNAGDPVLEIYCELADVVDEEGEPIVLRPIVNLKFSRGGKFQPSTLYLFAKAAGVAPPEGQPFDTDLLEGRVLQGMVQQEEGKWPRIEPKSLMPVKVKAMSQKAQEAPSEAAVPWQEDVVDADTVSAWWKDILGQGFERKAIVDLSKEMFERLPGELSADELKGLNDQLLATA